MLKMSVSLPDDLVSEIKTKYPDVPFSTVLSKLLRTALSGNVPASDQNVDETRTPSFSPLPDMIPTIREIIQEEISKAQPHEISIEKIREIIKTELDLIKTPQDPIKIESDMWYSIQEIRAMMPPSIPEGTKCSRVNRGIKIGELQTNGKARTACRIIGSSITPWLEKQ